MTAKFRDGDEQQYSTSSSTIDKDLLHDTVNEDDSTWMWNILYLRLCIV